MASSEQGSEAGTGSTRATVHRWWKSWRWPLCGLALVAAFTLMFVDSWEHTGSFEQATYQALENLGIARSSLDAAPSAKLSIARWLLVGFSAFVLWQAWARIFRDEYTVLRLRLLRNHTLICGAGEKGLALAAALRARGDRVVLIDLDQPNGAVRPQPGGGQLMLSGNALDPELLSRASADSARRVIAICGDDLVNAEIGERIRRVRRFQRGPGPECHVHIADLDLFHLLRERQIEHPGEAAGHIECFNVFALGARGWLERFPLPEDDHDRPPHLVLIGWGRLAENLAVDVARMQFVARDGRPPCITLTVVDQDAGRRTAGLLVRYPALARTAALNAVDLDLDSPALLRGEFLAAAERSHGPVSAVWISAGDDPTALTVGLAMRSVLRTRNLRPVVRVSRHGGLAALLGSAASNPALAEGMDLFALIPATCNADVILNGTTEILARAAHAAYVHDALAGGETRAGNPRLVPWDDLEGTFKDANRAQARSLGDKLRAAACGVVPLVDWDLPLTPIPSEHVETLSVMEHDRWVAERTRDGWRLGGVKDPVTKTHPDLVPWSELSEEVREKDRAVVRKTPMLLALAGFRIVPLR